MPTIFSKIVEGTIPAYKIKEDNKFLAFLDVNPLVEGHTLVIPKRETNYIFDIEDKEYQELWLFAKSVAKRLKAKIKCKKIGVAVVGLEVAHAHIHLIPIDEVADMDFSKEKLSFTQEQFQSTLENILA